MQCPVQRHLLRTHPMKKRKPLVLKVEVERESDQKWIVDIVSLPGVMAYGKTQLQAFRAAQALALEVIADRLKHGEDILTGKPVKASTPAFDGLEFERQALAR